MQQKDLAISKDLIQSRVGRGGILIPNRVLNEGRWHFTARDVEGNIKWEDDIFNIVVDQGLNYLLDAGLANGTQITAWYLALISASPTVAAADVPTSHAGWTEVTAYDEAARLAWTAGAVAAKSVSNSASPATFTISTNATSIGGAALMSVNTKGATTGSLYAAGAFTLGNKSLDDGETLDVTATFTQAAV